MEGKYPVPPAADHPFYEKGKYPVSPGVRGYLVCQCSGERKSHGNATATKSLQGCMAMRPLWKRKMMKNRKLPKKIECQNVEVWGK